MNVFKSLMVGTALVASIVLGGVPTDASAQKVLKMGHLNNDDPFENPAGAFGRGFRQYRRERQ